MKRFVLIFTLISVSYIVYSQGYEYKFRLLLKDKGQTGYSEDRPEQFLSERAIARRERQNLKIDESDFPISQEYIDRIEQTGCTVVARSKWLATVSVNCGDSIMVDRLKALPFVSSAKFVWRGHTKPPREIRKDSVPPYYPIVNDTVRYYYGLGRYNIEIQNGQALHAAGYKGDGIDIAVIDAGFNRLPYIEFLDNIHIKGYKSFLADNDDLFDDASQHGLNALSCMATNKPHRFIGTAPDASYWLLMSEDSRSEFPVEEDYWVAALEYADSVGVDVVNTSLGYYKFEIPSDSVTYAMMDGNTMLTSRAAARAVQKGMFLVCSAGNEGRKKWGKLSSPADAIGVLTVGAVKRDSIIAPFSSLGYTADLRVKPDVMSFGQYVPLVDDRGHLSLKSGTSFSTPIMTGMVACLWQAYPSLTNRELLDVIQRSSDRYNNPDERYGYGIPDMEKAMQLAGEITRTKGKNRIGISANFRIESDGIGSLRIVKMNDSLSGLFRIGLTRRVQQRDTSVFQGSFSSDVFETRIKANEKAVYTLKIKGDGVEDEFLLYF